MAKRKQNGMGEDEVPPEPQKQIRGGSDTLTRRGLKGIQFTATPEERALFHQASRIKELDMSKWLRKVAVFEAKRVIEEYKKSK